MYKSFKIVVPLAGILLTIPIGAIYRLNIEKWAEENGADKILTSGIQLMTESALGLSLIALFFMCVGGTIALWIDFYIKKNTVVLIPKVGKINETVRGKSFMNEVVRLDGFRYTECKFVNVTFIYNGGVCALEGNKIQRPIIKSEIKEVEAILGLSQEFKRQMIEQNPAAPSASETTSVSSSNQTGGITSANVKIEQNNER